MKSLRKKNLAKPAFLLLALVFPWFFILLNFNYGIPILNFVLLYVVAVSGLDIVFGYSGQISLGHAAYFAIGAYGSVLIHKYLGVPVIFSMLISSVLVALIGIVISYPASRLRFHFLSLATIAFGEIVYQLCAQSPGAITGNFLGVFTDPIEIFGFAFNTNLRFILFWPCCHRAFLNPEGESGKVQNRPRADRDLRKPGGRGRHGRECYAL